MKHTYMLNKIQTCNKKYKNRICAFFKYHIIVNLYWGLSVFSSLQEKIFKSVVQLCKFNFLTIWKKKNPLHAHYQLRINSLEWNICIIHFIYLHNLHLRFETFALSITNCIGERDKFYQFKLRWTRRHRCIFNILRIYAKHKRVPTSSLFSSNVGQKDIWIVLWKERNWRQRKLEEKKISKNF